MSTAAFPLSHLQQIEYLVDYEPLWDMAELIPTPPPLNGGRPRQYPNWALIFYDTCCAVYTSARRVETNLPNVWETIRDRFAKRYPDQPPLPVQAPRRHHWQYAKKIIGDDAWTAMRATFRERAVETAQEIGLFDPQAGSFTHPHKTQLVYGDGKVVAPASKYTPGDTWTDPETGEIRARRYDPDANYYQVGGREEPEDQTGTASAGAGNSRKEPGKKKLRGRRVRGLKTVHLMARSPDKHGRVMLDFDRCSDDKELTLAYEATDHLAPRVPGLHGVVWDGAGRGTHADHLGRRHGLHLISPPPPDSRGHTTGREADYHPKRLGSTDICHPDGTTRTHQLLTIRGAMHILEIGASGDEVHVPCRRLTSEHRKNRDRTHRIYNVYEVPDSSGGGTFRCPTLTTEQDERSGFNRAEKHRSIPPDDPDYPGLYHLRSDVESLNRAFDDTLWIRRARSLGMKGHLLDWLGYALLVNAVARGLHREIQAAPPTALPPPQPGNAPPLAA